ncbi:heterokaryon incompatibility protein-domain-containing protein [Cladorrhinum sp. PSN259]|nr:heterokaryon incompatibility protein-domain-containing protein [Cladorrhinum sp. PSN259]
MAEVQLNSPDSTTDPCPFCHNLNPKKGPGSRSSGKHAGVLVDLRVVKSRSSEGCHTCAVVEEALSLLDSEWYASIDNPGGECRGAKVHGFLPGGKPWDCTCDMFRLVSLPGTDRLLLCYPCGRFMEDVTSGSWKGSSLELYVKEGVPRPKNQIDLTSYHRASQGLTERLGVVRDLIDECDKKHGICAQSEFYDKVYNLHVFDNMDTFAVKSKRMVRKLMSMFTPARPRGVPELPRRLIDLRKFKSECKVNLLETAGFQETCKYTCLSYCWGTSTPYRTTTENFASNLEDIPWSDLPQTYKDAILVTSTLGIQFLWIDALCIIQGDQKDWELHASVMANIYGSATLVISALGASDVTQGFIPKPRTVLDIFPIVTSGLTVYCRRPLDHFWLTTDPSKLRKDIEEQIPVWSRGWCLQEEVLASRLLSFHGDEFFFQCRLGIYHCECNFRPQGCHEEDEMWGTTPMKIGQTLSLIIHERNVANYYWIALVNAYNNRKLTELSDKLPAISGMARVMQKQDRVDYLAGHWKDNLFFQSLCWYTIDEAVESSVGQTCYIVPSWSWMSFQGSIKNLALPPLQVGCYKILPRTKLLSHHVDLASKDPTGAILNCQLLVRGAFLDVEDKRTAAVDLLEMKRNNTWLVCLIDPGREIHIGDVLVCWLVIFPQPQVQIADRHADEYFVFCIVLRQVRKKNRRPVYERVGYYLDALAPDSDLMAFFEGWDTGTLMKKAYLV